MSETKFSKIARRVTEWSGSVYATVFAFLVVGGWIIGGLVWWGFGDDYQILINTFTTIVTFLMVFLIQHTQNHDTKAIHQKLNELLLKNRQADNAVIGIEALDEDQLEDLAKRYERIAVVCRSGNQQ